jgi:hypothetical protein
MRRVPRLFVSNPCTEYNGITFRSKAYEHYCSLIVCRILFGLQKLIYTTYRSSYKRL